MKRSQLWHWVVAFFTYAKKLIWRHYRALLALLIGVFLPLEVFGELAEEVWDQEGGFPWDEPILLALHAIASPGMDTFAIILTQFGVMWGVFPACIVVALILWRQRHWRSLTYFLTTVIGAAIINLSVKALLGRPRPTLWESPAPELDFGFPSGHAMASMTFVAALVILLRGSRWQKWAILWGGLFVAAIGWTRLYLGVHYPSDIVAGWMASIAWAVGVSLLIRPNVVSDPEKVPSEAQISQ